MNLSFKFSLDLLLFDLLVLVAFPTKKQQLWIISWKVHNSIWFKRNFLTIENFQFSNHKIFEFIGCLSSFSFLLYVSCITIAKTNTILFSCSVHQLQSYMFDFSVLDIVIYKKRVVLINLSLNNIRHFGQNYI